MARVEAQPLKRQENGKPEGRRKGFCLYGGEHRRGLDEGPAGAEEEKEPKEVDAVNGTRHRSVARNTKILKQDEIPAREVQGAAVEPWRRNVVHRNHARRRGKRKELKTPKGEGRVIPKKINPPESAQVRHKRRPAKRNAGEPSAWGKRESAGGDKKEGNAKPSGWSEGTREGCQRRWHEKRRMISAPFRDDRQREGGKTKDSKEIVGNLECPQDEPQKIPQRNQMPLQKNLKKRSREKPT